MQQEQDTCRICSGPGEPDQPLFYPCKCSGTIRYIHQDCLKTWLDHSKKTTCDVCKHPYTFTKVYAPDMPDKVPFTILVRKFAEQVIHVILFALRAVMVAFVWLTFLPYGTLLTWRLYFRFGNIIAWCISSHPIRRREPPSEPYRRVEGNATVLIEHFRDTVVRPYIHSLPGDIFTGQIIASLIVLVFLAVFLLREWIQQNARPGVFDDGAPQENARAPIQAPVQVADPIPAPPAVQPEEGHIDVEEPEAGFYDEEVPARPLPDVPTDVDNGNQSSPSSSDTESGRKLRRREKRARFAARREAVQNGGPTDVVPEEEDQGYEEVIARLRKEWTATQRSLGESSNAGSRAGGESVRLGEPYRPPENATAPMSYSEAVQGKGKRKAVDSDEELLEPARARKESARDSLSPAPGFEFTFQAPRVGSQAASSDDASQPNGARIFRDYPTNREISTLDVPRPESPSAVSTGAVHKTQYRSITPETAGHSEDSSDEEPAEFQRAKRLFLQEGAPGLRFSPPPRNASELPRATRRPYFTGLYNIEDEEDGMEVGQSQPPLAGPSQHPRRPPLPASVTPTSEHITNSASTSKTGTPLPSPSLATYRAPEELGQDDGYFRRPQPAPIEENDAEDEEEDDDEGRMSDYFVEPKGGDAARHGQNAGGGANDSDEDEDDEEAPDIARQEGGRDQANGEANLPAAEAQPAEVDVDDEDRDVNLDEDLDGAMEAIGLRGPVFAVFQNASLMFFILTITIGGGIWIPFTLGKTVALLTLEPRRALQIMHLPIRAVRLITDPTVDAVIYFMRWVSFGILNWFFVCFDVFKRFAFSEAVKPTTKVAASQSWLKFISQYVDVDRFTPSFESVFRQKAAPAPPVPSSVWTTVNNYVSSFARISRAPPVPITRPSPPSLVDHWLIEHAEDAFATIGKQVRLNFATVLKEWTVLAESDSNAARVWAVLLGYGLAGFLAALYLNTFTVGNVKSAGRAVRGAIKQQMIVMKVALFIIVELVVFPFGCGVMLDYSTLRLFSEANLETRLAFFARAPVTASFYHWLIGTMFMYQFAIMLATCRELLRPGCMWFIKDPQDPTFHPIRDILDRPTLAQLRKLGLSAIMYGVVIFFGVGQILAGLHTIFPYTFPLRWKMREPLSEVPVDLLFVHLVLPPSLRYFRPRKPLKKLLTLWWKWSASQLRLTSYMFGGRHPEEEFTPQRTWRSYLPWHKDEAPVTVPPRDGGFRRVPAGDNIAFLRDRPAMIKVDETGVALNDRGKQLMAEQDAEAIKGGRNPAEDYTIVYIPPNFLQRILLFISFFWVTGSVALFAAIAVPVFAGRHAFKLFTDREVHDGYSFIVGFYLVWWSWLIGNLFIKVRIRRLRHLSGRDALEAGLPPNTRVRASWMLFLFKRVTVYFSKMLWLVFWLGLVIPTLFSIMVDLYIVIPLRSFFNPGFTPTIHIIESWATGLILAKIVLKVTRARPGTDLAGAWEVIRRNGFRRPDPWIATRDFIAPVTAGLVGMIVLPPALVYAASKVLIFSMKLEDINRLVYPAIFVVTGTFEFAMSLTGVMEKWTQSIRDKEFLVELRLRNLEPNPKEKEKADMVQVDNDRKAEVGMQVDEFLEGDIAEE